MTTLEIAQRIVDQWDNHDKYREFPADKALYPNGQEPAQVELARAYIALERALAHCLENRI